MDSADPPPWTPSTREDPAWDEDFLYHLSRGSDLLVGDRVVEAKEELERALAHRPEDARSQDLLAGVYFRLGVYPRAIEIWSRLVRVHPDDVTLRVNLGLALLKTGQPEDALAHLECALEKEPDHARAWGYVGIVQWRLGHPELARDAFTRGGQIAMAKRMDELAPALGSPAAEAPDEPARAEVRTAASDALEALATAPLVVEASQPRRRDSGSGQWRVVEAGADPIPRTAGPSASATADGPPILGALLDRWSARVSPEEPLVVAATGALVVSIRGAVHCRVGTLRALRGRAERERVLRRTRRSGDEALGGDDPILRLHGDLLAMLVPRPGEHFQALRIEDDVVFFVERFVQAFDDRVSFESGRLPTGAAEGERQPLVQFRGTGSVVLRVPRTPTAVPVQAGQDIRVWPESLLGWTGRLFPVEFAGDGPGRPDPGGAIALRGDGALLLV